MINQPKKEWNHHEEAKIHVEEPWSSWLIMLKQSTVKQPWSGKTTFYHQAFCNVAHFLFLAYWNFRFQTNRPSLISVRTWVDSPELETSCHAYVLNCILCINWHFAVLIYNLFILPRIWFHPSHGPMNICSTRCSFGFMLAPKCVSRKTWNTSTNLPLNSGSG